VAQHRALARLRGAVAVRVGAADAG
jgi:hypothetical protein